MPAMSVEEITSRQYEQLINASQQVVWLRAALAVYGVDDLADDMTVSDLEDMYNEIIGDPDADAGNDTPQVDTGVCTCIYWLHHSDVARPKIDWHGPHTIDTAYAESPRDSNGKPDLSGLASQPKAQSPSPPPAPRAVRADNRHRPIKVPASRVKDLRRAALERTQQKANAGMKGHPSTNMNKVGQGHVSASSCTPVTSPSVASSLSSPAHATSNVPSARVPATPPPSTPGASSSHHPVAPSTAAAVSPRHAASLPRASVTSSPCASASPARTAQPHQSANAQAASGGIQATAGSRTIPRPSRGVPPPNPVQDIEPEGDLDDDENNGPDEDEDVPAPLTKRQKAQLQRFGPDYGPVVKKAGELMVLWVLVRCPFPEVTPVPPAEGKREDDDENPISWSLFDEWMPEHWDRANALERQDQPALIIRLQLSQPRTWLKAHLEVAVPLAYGFEKKKSSTNVQLSSNLIHQHAFIYAIRHVICEFRDGEWKKDHLSATIDVTWYRRYVSRLAQVARDTPTRLNNIRRDLLEICLRDRPVDDVMEDSEGSIDLGSDSEVEGN
ncbi:hypothetical protein FRC06_002308 [Ceratobasidium sp. 370]|nr:hypothetical protein FRC06_002308 [Ceratobasidium sp. 370]